MNSKIYSYGPKIDSKVLLGNVHDDFSNPVGVEDPNELIGDLSILVASYSGWYYDDNQYNFMDF